MTVKVFWISVHLCLVYTQNVIPESDKQANILDSSSTSTIADNIKRSAETTSEITATEVPRIIWKGKVLECPTSDIRKPWFPLPCKTSEDCASFDPTYLCCDSKCLKGITPPSPEPIHKRLLGVIEQQCPVEPLPEIFSIKSCRTDADCAPRICCRENGSVTNYCRTPVPKLDRLPYADDILKPFKLFFSYMQCTPAPPLVLDLFSKPCQSALDCFPNLCCQENGKKFCRPPKRSVLSLVAGITQKIGTNDVAKKLIERIT